MTQHIMLDIETLGLKPGCVVLSVALVRFSDLATAGINLQPGEQTRIGFQQNTDTINWWHTLPTHVWQAATDLAQPVVPALTYVTDWLQWAASGGDFFIWCHGAGFDAPILAEVFERFGVPCPWQYWQVRDTRTLYDLAGIKLVDFSEGERHIALNDAMAQTKAAKTALEILALRYAEAGK